jgi:hypothetical protein
MPAISTTDARALYTVALLAVYRERTTPTSFLRSFFPAKESPTKNVSIEVQRGTEKIAVDVARGTEGNRNSFSLSTEKIFAPPYYREYFDGTELDLYDRMMGSGDIDAALVGAFVDSVADKLRMLQDKIERAYELQCAQIFETGIVLLNNGTNIDFKRKTASKVDLSTSNYWADSGVDPATSITTGCDWLRKVGKAAGGVFDLICGGDALRDLINNTKVQDRGKIFNYALDTLNTPQRGAVGQTFHGEISAGSYRVRIWSYNQYYDNASGVSTPYVNPKKAILLPENPEFVLAFAAVPQLLGGNTSINKSAFVVGEYKDEKNTAHIYDIKSAGVAIPVSVDKIYTMKVVTG